MKFTLLFFFLKCLWSPLVRYFLWSVCIKHLIEIVTRNFTFNSWIFVWKGYISFLLIFLHNNASIYSLKVTTILSDQCWVSDRNSLVWESSPFLIIIWCVTDSTEKYSPAWLPGQYWGTMLLNKTSLCYPDLAALFYHEYAWDQF